MTLLSKIFGSRNQAKMVSMPIGADPQAVPVTLLTGFLGAGKTTFLNHLLADPRFADSAVIVNEFGSISIDHDLVTTGTEGVMITSTGCLCCTIGSDIRTSLFELSEAVEQRSAAAFSRVIVETTGLADPAPIVNSLIPGGVSASGFYDLIVALRFRLAGVITMLDAIEGETALEEHYECWKQLAFADHVVLTKTDLCDDAAAGMATWSERLRGLNPAALLHDRHHPGFDPTTIISDGLYAPSDRPEDVVGWLAMERLNAAEHSGHSHDADRHGEIRAFALTQEQPLDPADVHLFLKILTEQSGAGLLRVKGIFALSNDPTKPFVVHAVGRRLYPPTQFDRWPSADTSSRVVIIGRDLPIDPIRKFFDALAPRKRRRRRKVVP